MVFWVKALVKTDAVGCEAIEVWGDGLPMTGDPELCCVVLICENHENVRLFHGQQYITEATAKAIASLQTV